ncbi:hypothetical protein [Bacillus wiedmannii]|uniref:Group-specific protein n=1 Tax=Bacillus wiedmannii TaxID=1890302 RepID=A0ABX5DM10_9BACI|nr:hypothetical protein [Bacillus wiedmannii]PRT36920.1 hypothetical protein C6357_27470 [Bacillus wiedmannii]
MLNTKFSRIIGALALSGVLIIPALPVNASENVKQVATISSLAETSKETNILTKSSSTSNIWTMKVGDTKSLYSAKGYSYETFAGWNESSPSISASKDSKGNWTLKATKETDPDGSSLLIQYKDGKVVASYEVIVKSS